MVVNSNWHVRRADEMCLVGSRDFGLGILLAVAGSMEDEIKADSGVSALRNRDWWWPGLGGKHQR